MENAFDLLKEYHELVYDYHNYIENNICINCKNQVDCLTKAPSNLCVLYELNNKAEKLLNE